MTTPRPADLNRREFKRVHAPVFCRPVGLLFKLLPEKQQALDISLGGMRIYSDEPLKKGAKLAVELFMPDATTVSCKVEVVWIEALPEGSPAKHDVGLKFIDIRSDDQARLATLLDDTGTG